jgi:hypothetical protein
MDFALGKQKQKEKQTKTPFRKVNVLFPRLWRER